MRNRDPSRAFWSALYSFLPLFLVLGLAAWAMMRWGR
jgi:hypothetical protein